MLGLISCQKLAKDIEPSIFRNIRCTNPNWNYYKSMVLFLFGTFNGIHDETELFNRTKFNKKIIKTVCDNLSSNRIWKDGVANIEFNEDDAFALQMEIVLCSMCAVGELRRFEDITYPVPAFPLPILPIPFETLLALKEAKERQSERESKPYEFKTYGIE